MAKSKKKSIIETKVCEHYGLCESSIGYCKAIDVVCLIEKHGFENIRKYTISLPYDKTDIIYGCDGIIPKTESKKYM